MSKNQVLSLYRSLLKDATQLSYSDSSYVRQRIRREFELNSTLSDKESIQRCIDSRTPRIVAAIACAIVFIVLNKNLNISHVESCPFVPPLTDNLYIENRNSLSKQFGQDRIEFVMAASQRPIRVDSDTDYPGYRQASNIIYLLGQMNISPALVFGIWNGSSLSLNLFVPEQSQRERIFGGDLLNKNALKSYYLLDSVNDMKQILDWVGNNVTVNSVSPIQDVNAALGTELRKVLDDKAVVFHINTDLIESFHRSRFNKSFQEIEMIKFATKVAKWAHKIVENMVNSYESVSEMDLFSNFNYYSSLCGGRLSAYNPIVGFGLDSATLHFRTGENETRGYQRVSSSSHPQFILLDAASEYKGYASDITRTIYPKYSKKHELIYNIVQNSQNAAISKFTFGSTWKDVEIGAYYSLTRSLQENNFFYKNTSLEDLLFEKAHYAFMPHGLGHPVGLDVHDPVPKSFKANGTYTLDNGIVHTIEPGIYFIPFFMESLKSNLSSIGRFINWTTVHEYMDIGGVRIEDVLSIVNNSRIIF